MISLLFKYLRLSPSERYYLNEALAFSCLARFMTCCIPLRIYGPALAMKGEQGKNNDQTATSVRIAVLRVSKHVPWRCKCLEQAIIAKLMMNRRRCLSTLVLGLKKSEGKLIAHAWLVTPTQIITGRYGRESFTIIWQIA